MNPMDMMQIAGKIGTFKQEHPKFEMFVKDRLMNGLEAGTVVELKIVKPDGETAVTNIRVTDNDVELFSALKDMKR